MKKLMIVAAAAAMVASAQAGIAVKTINCNVNPTGNCDDIVFKVTGSGKVLDTESKDYTTVSKLKVNGWLVMFPSDFDGDATTVDDCCYPTYSLYVSTKIGKNTKKFLFAGASSEAIDAWTVFGKKLGNAVSATKSGKYKLESQLGISADYAGNKAVNAGGSGDGLFDVDDLTATPGITFIATAFGKATWRVGSKTNCTACGKEKVPDGYDVTPGSYSGWFAGVYDLTSVDEECLTCTCTNLGVFGGTWKAKYQTKVTTWQAAARDVFGAAFVSANMGEDGELGVE